MIGCASRILLVVELIATRISRMAGGFSRIFARRRVNCNADYAEGADFCGFFPVVGLMATRTTRMTRIFFRILKFIYLSLKMREARF
jgi:hypothetical protein